MRQTPAAAVLAAVLVGTAPGVATAVSTNAWTDVPYRGVDGTTTTYELTLRAPPAHRHPSHPPRPHPALRTGHGPPWTTRYSSPTRYSTHNRRASSRASRSDTGPNSTIASRPGPLRTCTCHRPRKPDTGCRSLNGTAPISTPSGRRPHTPTTLRTIPHPPTSSARRPRT